MFGLVNANYNKYESNIGDHATYNIVFYPYGPWAYRKPESYKKYGRKV